MTSSETTFIWPVSFKSRRMFEIPWTRGECVGSKCFAVSDDSWWNLFLYPLGDPPFKRGDVTLRICRQSSGTKIFVEGEIQLYRPHCKEYKYPVNQTLAKTDTYIRVPLFGCLKEMYRCFPSTQELYIKCKIYICEVFSEKSDTVSETSGGTLESFDVQIKNPCQDLEKLSADLKVMFKKEYFSDIRLHCGNVNLPVHKNVLSARSKTFAKMFKPSPLSPKTKNSVIVVKNMDVNVLEEMVLFIYSGKLSGLCSDMAGKLFIASIDYGLEDLKSICYDFIISKLTLHTVVEMLLFAEKHNCADLKKPLVEFLLGHFSEIKQTDSWKKFIKEQPGLGVEILSSIMETSNSKKCLSFRDI